MRKLSMFPDWPDRMWPHPVYRYETRHDHGATQAERSFCRMIRRSHVILLVVWVLGFVKITTTDGWSEYVAWQLRAFTTDMGVVVGGLAWLASGLLDVASIRAGIAARTSPGYLDLLRLTPLSRREIIRAKHAVARLHVWHMTAVIVSIRLAMISLGLFAVLVLPFLLTGRNDGLVYLAEDLTTAPLASLFRWSAIVMLMLAYALEPFWRMQALSALGMLIAMRIVERTLALLLGFGMVLLVWMSQGLILALLFGFQLLIFGAVGSSESVGSAAYWPQSFILFIVSLCVAGGGFGLFRLLQSLSLRGAQRRIARMD